MSTLRNLCAVFVVAALAAATPSPATAQRLSLAERVTLLENQANAANAGAGQSSLDAQNRVTQLQGEVASLRNLVETLQHQVQQLERAQRQLGENPDRRSDRPTGDATSFPPVSRDAASATSAPRTGEDTGAFVDATDAAGDADDADATDMADVADAADADVADSDAEAAARPVDPAAEEAAYQAALDALVERFEPAESARLFRRFIDDHPDSLLLPNAWYWLGESYYVTQNYELGVDAFRTLLDDHPGSRKEADALLKLGYSQIALGDIAAGEDTLLDLVGRYPGTDASAKAESRLRTLALENR